MKVWRGYFENCNNDSNFQCWITASQRERDGEEEEREKKIIPVLIEFAISLAVPDRWIMNIV